MKRFILHSYLKPEKVEEYVKLHAEPWPELVQLMTECNLHNYSISIRGDGVVHLLRIYRRGLRCRYAENGGNCCAATVVAVFQALLFVS